VEQALAAAPGPDILLRAAAADADAAENLPATWLDMQTHKALRRVREVLTPAHV
jgi:hypothetical protein